jgi:hypothetical protein
MIQIAKSGVGTRSSGINFYYAARISETIGLNEDRRGINRFDFPQKD